MRFFVPGKHPQSDDARLYEALAAFAGRAPAPPQERVYSITFTHDGTVWTATVGEQLRGIHYRRARRRGQMVDLEQRRHDAATVQAVFAGDPYLVVTDARPLSALLSEWANPFMAGRPTSVELFSGGTLHDES